MSSTSSNAANLFSFRVETRSSLRLSFGCQFLFVYSCLGASFFSFWCLVYVVTSNVDAVSDGHVGNHARFVSHV